MNPRIFREYDIRGAAERDLPNDVVRAIGLAIGESAYAGPGPVVVGRDCRLSSPRIFAALTDGIRAHADVVDIGIVPTPVAYFAEQHLLAAATVMITGSHNPAEDNGLKIMLGEATLHGEAIAALGRRAADLLDGPGLSPRGAISAQSVSEAYIARAVAALRLGRRRPKVVVDAGNGAGGPTATALYAELGFDVVPLYCDFDGSFPHHHPDPTQPENLSDLISTVQHLGAELGIALDGDADRIGVVDATGRVLWGDQLMVLLGRAVLDEVPDARFVAEVKCSQAMYDALPSCEMWKVGHSLIKARMRQTGAQLAGEMSGHLFFAHRWLGFDDGIYAGARLLELLSRSDRSLAEMAAELPKIINTPEIRIDCPDDLKFDVVARVTESLRHDLAVEDVVTIDGVRARFADGWGLVRASNTQPALVVRCEARDRESLDTIRRTIDDHVTAARSGERFRAPLRCMVAPMKLVCERGLSITELLAEPRAKIRSARQLTFEGVAGKDVYNPTAPFFLDDKTVLAARVESPELESDSQIVFFALDTHAWSPLAGVPRLALQDPAVAWIDNELVLAGVEVWGEKKALSYKTAFYRGSPLRRFAEGPIGMKDIRLIALDDGRVLALTRPQGGCAGRGKIGCVVLADLDAIHATVLDDAPIIIGQFIGDEWGGANEIIRLSAHKLGVLGHVARFDEHGDRHYYPIAFTIDLATGRVSTARLLFERADLPGGTSGPAKRPDLRNVLFSGGIVRHGNDTATVYVGVGDKVVYAVGVRDPFTA